jgi:hypothetical protein
LSSIAAARSKATAEQRISPARTREAGRSARADSARSLQKAPPLDPPQEPASGAEDPRE